MHVLPLGHGRKGHQDGLVPGPRRVEAELGAAVVDEVELGVVASADQLPLALSVTWTQNVLITFSPQLKLIEPLKNSKDPTSSTLPSLDFSEAQ